MMNTKMKNFLRKFLPIAVTLKITDVHRTLLNSELKKMFKRLKKGTVLDVGSRFSPYKQLIPYTTFLTLDIDKRFNPDLCCDVHNIKCKSNSFDTIIATELLEHLHNPQKAIDEIYRILKPRGILILSAPFIYPYHPDPTDYYRYSEEGLRYLLRKFRKVEIHKFGNKLQVTWQLINYGYIEVVLNIFNQIISRLSSRPSNIYFGIVSWCQK